MLSVSSSTRIFISIGATDMRKDSMACVVWSLMNSSRIRFQEPSSYLSIVVAIA